MKPLLLTLCLLTGCVTGCVNVKKLATLLDSQPGVWSIERRSVLGTLKISRANPVLGTSASVIKDGLTFNAPTNLNLQLSYVVPVNSPTATNSLKGTK